jgi:tetratricopeptide (TPR) repeat protein
LAAAYAKNPGDRASLLVLSNLQAFFGSPAELEATCRIAVGFAAKSDDPHIPEQTAKACSLMPLDDRSLREAALTLARKAVEGAADDYVKPWRLLALGMAEYRNDHYREAIASLEAALSYKPKPEPDIVNSAMCFRAMSLRQLGESEEARHVLDDAATRIDDHLIKNGSYLSYDSLMGLTVLNEASELLGPDDE